MKISGYPAMDDQGAIWIVTPMSDGTAYVREAAYLATLYLTDTEDDALDAIETGAVRSDEWQVTHDPSYRDARW